MGKISKFKSESKLPDEAVKGNDSDIFKLLFGREAPEEVGLGPGLELGSNPRTGEIKLQRELDSNETNVDTDDSKKKKRKKGKKEKSDSDEQFPETMEAEPDKVKKRKKEVSAHSGLTNADDPESADKGEEKAKTKKKAKPVSDVDLAVTAEAKKKENERESDTNVVSVVEIGSGRTVEGIGNLKDKKKKKRKRDEIEEAYEAKAYGAVANVNGKEEGNRVRKVGEKRKTGDDPAEMLVSKEGFDDEIKLLRTIFVGNLPLKLKKKILLKEFSKFGEIDSVRIRSVPIVDSKTPRKGAIMKGKINEAVDSVHAYIVFKDEKSAQASLAHNMAVVGGNHIRVDKACPPRKKLKAEGAPVYDNQRTVFVGNLPFDVKDEEIYQLFCGVNQVDSDIEGVRVIRDPNSSVGKGIAYVLFKTKEAANLVIKKRQLKIRDRFLRLYHAKSDVTPSKKRTLPNTSADNSTGKRLAVTSAGRGQDKNKPKAKTALSYQGLTATKSIQKKEAQIKKEGQPKDGFRRRISDKGKGKPGSAAGVEAKEHKNKRPAVAARKAKALKGAEAAKKGVKRKPESRTPDSSSRNKKARRF